MRFLHTADWHLGRLFHGTHLTEDQAHVLEQLVDICRDRRPDFIVVAGDIYDRAVPPPDAVALLDDVLSRLVLRLRISVVLIAGNHDSPGRLHFGSQLLEGQRLYVRGQLAQSCEPVIFQDAHGPVHIYPLPYADPATVRSCLSDESVIDHDTAMRASTKRIRASHPTADRSILVAHAFVAGAAVCESERPLSVGGAGTVDASCFGGFDYVALGHLHRAQRVAAEGSRVVEYSGSPLKYSFDEADHSKSITMVEMSADGSCVCDNIALIPRRDVRRIRGTMADLLASPGELNVNDYLEVTLLDDGPVFDAVGRLRDVYPNVAVLKRQDVQSKGPRVVDAVDHRTMTELELFRAFFRHVTGKELEAPQEGVFTGAVEELQRVEREAGRLA